MGRYFSISNDTRNVCIREGNRCWKGNSQCDIHSVMHKFHWSKKDKISTSCYDTRIGFSYDKKRNIMVGKEINIQEMTLEYMKRGKAEAITKAVMETLERLELDSNGETFDVLPDASTRESSGKELEENPKKKVVKEKPCKKLPKYDSMTEDSEEISDGENEEKPCKKLPEELRRYESSDEDCDDSSGDEIEKKPWKKPSKKKVDIDEDESCDECQHKRYDFYMHDRTIKLTQDHVPLWNGNTCVVCGYECAGIIIPEHKGKIYVV